MGTPGPPAAFLPSSSSSEVSADPGLRGEGGNPWLSWKIPQGKAASRPQSCHRGGRSNPGLRLPPSDTATRGRSPHSLGVESSAPVGVRVWVHRGLWVVLGH